MPIVGTLEECGKEGTGTKTFPAMHRYGRVRKKDTVGESHRSSDEEGG